MGIRSRYLLSLQEITYLDTVEVQDLCRCRSYMPYRAFLGEARLVQGCTALMNEQCQSRRWRCTHSCHSTLSNVPLISCPSLNGSKQDKIKRGYNTSTVIEFFFSTTCSGCSAEIQAKIYYLYTFI